MTTKIQKAFAAAEKLLGPMAAGLVNGYGATNGDPDDVPEDRKAEALAALESIAARGERVPVAMACGAIRAAVARRRSASPRRRSMNSSRTCVRVRSRAHRTPTQNRRSPCRSWTRWRSMRAGIASARSVRKPRKTTKTSLALPDGRAAARSRRPSNQSNPWSPLCPRVEFTLSLAS